MGFKGKNLRLLFVWICGYGFGTANTSQFIDNPRYHLVALILGLIIGFSGWFWDYAQKPGGLIDKKTEKIMMKKYGADYVDYKSRKKNVMR